MNKNTWYSLDHQARVQETYTGGEIEARVGRRDVTTKVSYKEIAHRYGTATVDVLLKLRNELCPRESRFGVRRGENARRVAKERFKKGL